MCAFGNSLTCKHCFMQKSKDSYRCSYGHLPRLGIEIERSCGGTPIEPITKMCFQMDNLGVLARVGVRVRSDRKTTLRIFERDRSMARVPSWDSHLSIIEANTKAPQRT